MYRITNKLMTLAENRGCNIYLMKRTNDQHVDLLAELLLVTPHGDYRAATVARLSVRSR
ncbi:hypothetical protein SAMN05414139_10551 [Burkholderia sp. D7]|nr:hypothetical protein SAMN05414139_10551 [Burkholderia sp. D7]